MDCFKDKMPRYLRDGHAIFTADGDKSRHMAVSVTLRSVALSIAQLAVDLAVGGVARQHGVQRAVTLAAVVATFVPFLQQKS